MAASRTMSAQVRPFGADHLSAKELGTTITSDVVRRALAGDRAAFMELVAPHQDRLYRTAYAILGRTADAADALQETWLSAYQGIGRLNEPCFLGTWLTRILVNNCLLIRRRRERELPVDLGDRVVGLPLWPRCQPADDGEPDLLPMLADLEEHQRVVVVLRYVQGMRLDDIAAVLGCPLGTVKSRLHAALVRLRRAAATEAVAP